MMQSQPTQSPLIKPPPPPPPPMPQESRQNPPGLDIITSTMKPNLKMRTLNWRKISKGRVLTEQQQVKRGSNDSINSSDGENKNVWLLIAKANKSIKEVGNKQSNSSTAASQSKSASRIKEMLESVRKRMAATKLASPSEQASQEGSSKSKSILEMIDFDDLENLFSLNTPNHASGLDSDLPQNHGANFVRRSSMRTNISSDSVISSNSFYYNDVSGNNIDDNFYENSNCGDSSTTNCNYDGDDATAEQENDEQDEDSILEDEIILDSKKSLNVNIFLKQLKCQNIDGLIEKINLDKHGEIGKEKLENLIKLLPDETELNKLKKFNFKKNKHKQIKLPIAEKFLLQLINEVPNLKLKIKFMLLKEEYECDLKLISPELDKIEKASREIRKSLMLRDLLNLVLVTGNFLNTGGYAADAAGFTLDCLIRLNEIRSNEPNLYLIHYLADMATRMNLIDFLKCELQHLESASKVSIELIQLDLNSISARIQDIKLDIDKEFDSTLSDFELDKNSQFYLNLLNTLQMIKHEVDLLNKRIGYDLNKTRLMLANYLCEDPITFKLDECFNHLLNFSLRLKTAADENVQRAKRKQRIQSTKSSLRRSNTIHPKFSHHPQSRLSLGNNSTFDARQQNRSQSHYSSANTSNSSIISDNLQHNYHLRSKNSLDSNMSSRSNLSRATSTFNINKEGSTNNVDEFDDLHEGLMRLLQDTTTTTNQTNSIGCNRRRASDCFSSAKTSSSRIPLIGSYRRTSSRLFRPSSKQ